MRAVVGLNTLEIAKALIETKDFAIDRRKRYRIVALPRLKARGEFARELTL